MSKLLTHPKLIAWSSICGLAVAVLASAPARGQHDEYAVKAAFIHNFAMLVEWPETSFESPDSPLRLAIVGSDDFAPSLAAYFREKKVGVHPIRVMRIANEAGVANHHIVFVGGTAPERLRRLVAAARASQALTIGETEEFARGGGMIGFFREGNRIRFAINRPAAEKAGLKISSRLLSLAKLVADDGS